MAWVAVAVAGSNLVGSLIGSDAQRSAGNTAADATRDANQQAIAEQQRQFDAVRKLLDPYVQAGAGALGAQQNLAGLNGYAPQQAAIQALQGSPAFTAAQQLGENRILANASATGGLRGGNVQAALAQFNPALLASTINDQYARLGGLTSIGQNAAAGVGNAGMATGNNVSQLLQGIGSANAGAALSAGRSDMMLGNGLTGTVGMLKGMGTLDKLFGGGSGGGYGGSWDWTGMGGVF